MWWPVIPRELYELKMFDDTFILLSPNKFCYTKNTNYKNYKNEATQFVFYLKILITVLNTVLILFQYLD